MSVSSFISTLLIASLTVTTSTTHNQTLHGGSAASRARTKPCSIPITLQCRQPKIDIPSIVPDLLKFVDQRLAVVYPIIQKFKSVITSDPLNITQSWVGADICSYRGFYCDAPPYNSSATALASIDFNGFGLGAASLDGFLDQLPDIALFHANSNNFSGTISPALASLQFLYELDISNNKFSGEFPTAVLGMPGLTFLDIRFNSFSGQVPPEIFAQNIEALFINNNGFTFITLPENLGTTTHVVYLTLANNRFVGPIPRGIFRYMSTLTEILLLNNRLTGCVPYEVGLLSEAVVLDVGRNRLMGPLPASLGCLGRAEQLNFAGNMIHGMVPEVVCGLRNLVNLSLSDNYLTVVGPYCRMMIRRGVVDVRNNCIPGMRFQRPIGECVAFFSRPRFCPFMWSYTYIPCRGRSYGSFVPQLAPSP